MEKSIYSLVLMDDVVREIDKMAYEMNTSRSNLINQILAEHVSIYTPEKRMKDIFNQLETLVSSTEALQVQPSISESMMMLKSFLKYKYKPTIKYSIELYKDSTDIVGELKAVFRTQSETLIEAITTFYIIWNELEQKYIGKYFPNGKIPFEVREGRFVRKFIMPVRKEKQSNEQIAFAISEYVKMLDYILKVYFDNLSDLKNSIEKMEEEYANWIKRTDVII